MTTNDTTNATTKVTTFECETCSRCGGSGEYSYCTMYGTTCFKCRGAKRVYTKRGAAAKAYLRTLRSRKASELKVGDKIKWNGLGKPVFVTIESIEAHDFAKHGGSITRDETTGEYKYSGPKDAIQIKTNKVTFSCVALDSEYEVLLSEEEQQATFAKALEYQNTLTKSGTPRKR